MIGWSAFQPITGNSETIWLLSPLTSQDRPHAHARTRTAKRTRTYTHVHAHARPVSCWRSYYNFKRFDFRANLYIFVDIFSGDVLIEPKRRIRLAGNCREFCCRRAVGVNGITTIWYVAFHTPSILAPILPFNHTPYIQPNIRSDQYAEHLNRQIFVILLNVGVGIKCDHPQPPVTSLLLG